LHDVSKTGNKIQWVIVDEAWLLLNVTLHCWIADMPVKLINPKSLVYWTAIIIDWSQHTEQIAKMH